MRLDEWNGLGFLAAAFVQTRHLRPAFLPNFTGGDCFFAGYRVFCRYVTAEERELQGLRIIRSDTDKKMMTTTGTVLAHYNYQARLEFKRNESGRGPTWLDRESATLCESEPCPQRPPRRRERQ